ncbi:DUF3881 family protein [Lachnoclostridium sp. Marseille-P6806]|uniref:DUF3881 family protein n=1 Tax=Lachnoclostridium sp. Marseille-P6806 TaxID=2364793 RepID=UPI0010325CDB|nr:DUF3881 family protein [Lachnoclostridium sp. Marseille-P6806]
MNKFFRAIGFSEPMSAAGLQILINQVLITPEYRAYTTNGEDTLLAEFRMSCGPDFGVSVVGEFDAEDQFRYEYCYPYAISSEISTSQKITIEPRIREEMYAGVCDDLKVGVTLIFHLQNLIDCAKLAGEGNADVRDLDGNSVMLTALSSEGTIMLPVMKTVQDVQVSRRRSEKRTNLLRQAMDGDDGAMQNLTMQDMDMYAAISHQIQTNDVYSLVDSYFMPYGVECDMYSVMGDIRECEIVRNKMTDEELWRLVVDCNGLRFALMIHTQDLYGEPEVGRRFKGVVWMQGTVQFGTEL